MATLLDKYFKKKGMDGLIGNSTYTINNPNHGNNIITNILLIISKMLNDGQADIMGPVPDKEIRDEEY